MRSSGSLKTLLFALLLALTVASVANGLDKVEWVTQFGTSAEEEATPSRGSPRVARISKGIIDHYKCYTARTKGRTPKFQKREVPLEDQFEIKESRVMRENLVCNPVSKDGEEITNPFAHLVCYTIRDKKPKFQKHDVVTKDQFGQLILTVQKPTMLCVPAGERGTRLINETGEKPFGELLRL